MRLYRGTQQPEVQGHHALTSWTPSLPVALVYSARPGSRIWRQPPELLEGSTIHRARLPTSARILSLCGGSVTCSLWEVMSSMDYGAPNGATDDDVRRILNYMHNRLTGRAQGGPFEVRASFPDRVPITEEDVPFSVRRPQTEVSVFRDDVWDDEGPSAGSALRGYLRLRRCSGGPQGRQASGVRRSRLRRRVRGGRGGFRHNPGVRRGGTRGRGGGAGSERRVRPDARDDSPDPPGRTLVAAFDPCRGGACLRHLL